MQELKALKPFRIGSSWLAKGDDVPLVEGFDFQKAARKGFLEEVSGEEVINPVRGGIQHIQPVSNDSDPNEQLALANQNLSAELTQARAEITALHAAALPSDALARINAVKGVGEALADAIFAALTKPAEEAKAK